MDRIGKYQIVSKIGTGGFGVVYKAIDPFIKRTVAIKTCTAEDAETRERFVREAEICGNLHHRNIVTVYEFGYEQNIPYLVQEYLSGEDLDQKIKRREDVPLPERILWLIQIARGLAYAHARGVIHRDVKPSNVRILEDGTAKILDFGIAKLLRSSSNLTQAGITLGTAAYLAPEQIKSEPIDARTDLFSFGALAYELLTYERPFQAPEIPAILYKILHSEPSPLSEKAPECPMALAEIVHRCLSKNREKRFAPTDTLVAALEGIARSRNPLLVDSVVTPRQALMPPSVPVTTQPIVTDTPEGRRSPSKSEPKEEGSTARLELHEVELLSPQGTLRPRSAGMTTVAFRRRTGWKRWATLAAGAVGIATLVTGLAYLLVRATAPVALSSPEAGTGGLPGVVPLAQPARTQSAGVEAGGAPVSGIPSGATLPTSQASPEPTPEPTPPPPPQPARLVVGPGWGSGLSVLVGGREWSLDRERVVELEPGNHSVRFRLQTPEYTFEERVRLRLDEGQTRRVEIPLQPPGKLTVQAHLETPPGIIRINSTEAGASPLRGKWLLPGSHQVEIVPISPSASSSTLRETILISSGQETVVTFDLEQRQPLHVRQKPLSAN